MAFTSAISSAEPWKFSLGPVQLEIQSFTMLSTDTAGTVTASRLSRIDEVIVIGGPECTGKTITNGAGAPSVALTFADPAAACAGYAAATGKGTILLLGR